VGFAHAAPTRRHPPALRSWKPQDGSSGFRRRLVDHDPRGVGGSRGATARDSGVLDESIVGRLACVAANGSIVCLAISTRQTASSSLVRAADWKATDRSLGAGIRAKAGFTYAPAGFAERSKHPILGR
jgi:hypothetical protein